MYHKLFLFIPNSDNQTAFGKFILNPVAWSTEWVYLARSLSLCVTAWEQTSSRRKGIKVI